jgi:hypothetical protein
LSQQAFSKHGEYMTFLKKDHAITHGFANFITLKFREADAGSSDADDLITIQYKGKDKPYVGRLETSGPFGTMCTHKIQLTELEQVDDELLSWIKEAYEQAK